METTTVQSALKGFAQYLSSHQVLAEQTTLTALEQCTANQIPFITYLAQQQIIDSATLAEYASKYFGMPLFDLDAANIDNIPNDFLHTEIVQAKAALPLFKTNNSIYLAIADPTIPSLKEINFITGLNTKLILVEHDKLLKAIDKILSTQIADELGTLADEDLDNINITTDDDITDTEDENDEVDNAPVVRFINKVLLDAVSKGASDIHFEPYEKVYRIRFRQDGILTEIATPPLKMANYLVARLKVMSNLDISERRLPQDGRFKLNLSKHRSIDFRVSSCPTLWGEKVVMRILESSNELLNIDGLGFTEPQKQQFSKAIQRSQGMILVTGPTGSGKTVTLYTALDILNSETTNISSIEDPIEIQLQGINQVQVNSKIGLSFASALRTFLRQDPDIVMVGEIRDQETAEIAVKAAQTGHLVFSTLHTNSASETLIRLTNMGVATYNVASSIKLIVAQRLVRRLCDNCKEIIDIPTESLLEEGFSEEEIPSLQIYGPKGCEHCNHGYKGRIGIYEVLPITEELGNLVMSNANANEIATYAKTNNIWNLRDSGLDKVRHGISSLEEVNRVIQV